MLTMHPSATSSDQQTTDDGAAAVWVSGVSCGSRAMGVLIGFQSGSNLAFGSLWLWVSSWGPWLGAAAASSSR